MPILSVLISVLGAACLALFVLRVRDRYVARQEASASAGEHFIGGGTWCPNAGASSRATWPLVRLEIFEAGIVVGPTSRWLSWAVPRVFMQWADISSVESRPTGVRINLNGEQERSLLFQLHRDAVLAALRIYPIELRA